MLIVTMPIADCIVKINHISFAFLSACSTEICGIVVANVHLNDIVSYLAFCFLRNCAGYSELKFALL
jgi:hypothetical protein